MKTTVAKLVFILFTLFSGASWAIDNCGSWTAGCFSCPKQFRCESFRDKKSEVLTGSNGMPLILEHGVSLIPCTLKATWPKNSSVSSYYVTEENGEKCSDRCWQIKQDRCQDEPYQTLTLDVSGCEWSVNNSYRQDDYNSLEPVPRRLVRLCLERTLRLSSNNCSFEEKEVRETLDHCIEQAFARILFEEKH